MVVRVPLTPWFMATICFAVLALSCGRHAATSPTAPRIRAEAETKLQPPGLLGGFAFLRRHPEFFEGEDWSKLVPAGSLFFPLAVGNRWHYSELVVQRVIPSGDSVAGPPQEYRDAWWFAVSSKHSYYDQTYYGVTSIFTLSSLTWRQDPSGLYQLAMPIASPSSHRLHPESAADSREPLAPLLLGGGPILGEASLLRYPLRPGLRWTTYEREPETRTVEGVDALDLPVGRERGYRIAVAPDGTVDRTSLRFWYGRCGLLGAHQDYDYLWYDENGHLIGRVIGEATVVLDSLDLVGYHPGCLVCP